MALRTGHFAIIAAGYPPRHRFPSRVEIMSLRANETSASPAKKRKLAFTALPRSLSQSKPRTKEVSASVIVSLALHALVLFVLSWIYFDLPRPMLLDSILTLVVADEKPSVEAPQLDLPTDEADLAPAEMGELLSHLDLSEDLTQEPVESVQSLSTDLDGVDRPKVVQNPQIVVPPIQRPAAKRVTSKKRTSGRTGNGGQAADPGEHVNHFVGRSPKSRAALVKRMGGTDASEAAVARGLVWLKNHQRFDGSWNFNHAHYPACDCSMPGYMDNNPNAATAMALMAFLGAGQTHEEGEYQTEVLKGLDFLMQNGMEVESGICFYGNLAGPPTYYTHGLATIALSEALAMTGDARLRPVVTGAVEFLVATQELGGGWRYYPGQPGDTSVVGWQLMALKSAQCSRIPIPQRVFSGIDQFLVGVSSMRGSQYAYTPQRRDAPTPSMTAVGLLSRMYLEWKDNGRLAAGVRLLDEHGPDYNDMYYNYYATQVMHHWGGAEWDRWNLVMRERLIRTQIQEGHATGSWDVADYHGRGGGRLYMTTLALLTLEVYYRHLPLYQKDRIEIPLLDKTQVDKTQAEPKTP
ncbi:prenyltransferase/squalene oxidase repeat-containing protein [Schlesneria sp.]|uniref:prenyltransferase/squalene oxidase repeat-containing protein n=1 Tax=Schlesneria sp. TaxID=2762018 RepID=UPI002F0F7C17